MGEKQHPLTRVPVRLRLRMTAQGLPLRMTKEEGAGSEKHVWRTPSLDE
jgi:hypothetical protein